MAHRTQEWKVTTYVSEKLYSEGRHQARCRRAWSWQHQDIHQWFTENTLEWKIPLKIQASNLHGAVRESQNTPHFFIFCQGNREWVQ